MKLTKTEEDTVRAALTYAIQDRLGLIDAFKGQYGDLDIKGLPKESRAAIKDIQRDLKKFRALLTKLRDPV